MSRFHTYERREKCARFWWESLKGRDHKEDQGIDRWMESEWIDHWEIFCGVMGWIQLDRDQWWGLVNVVMNLWILMPWS
jgi:hypothetical protein